MRGGTRFGCWSRYSERGARAPSPEFIERVRRLRARARELDQRVQAAIGELKVLSGLLPICGWCKKIREDRGCWSKIEAYLSAHTDARFAHGICPECTKKMISEESFGRSSISHGPSTGPGPGPGTGAGG